MKTQIAKSIFLANLAIMKKVLDLIAFKVDKNSEDYKYYKKEIMDSFYTKLKKLFSTLETEKVIKKCSCGTNLRKGYRSCDCGGSGWINA